MSQIAVIKQATEPWAPITQYDKNKWCLGDLIKKRDDITGSKPFIGPCITSAARPVEQSAAVPGVYPFALQWVDRNFRYSTGTVGVTGTAVTGSGTQWMTTGITLNVRIGFGSTDETQITTWYNIDSIQSNTGLTLTTPSTTYSGGTPYVIENFKQIDWIFLADGANGAATRRVQLYEYDRMISTWGWRGFITITPTAAGTHVTRGLRMDYQKYTTGTITSVVTTAVTGSGTSWVTDRMCVGSRIGFGSTDPTQISYWRVISAIGSDTGMTLSTSGTTVTAGTPYVIEDLRAYYVTTSTTNGGLFVAKGINYFDFTPGGTTIPIGAGTDNLKQTYWLKDATTINNTGACGLGMEDFSTWTTRYVYVPDTATMKIYKYNVRGALTLTGAADTSNFVLATGNQAVAGTISQTNNGRVVRASHGPLAGIDSLYFVTTARIYGVPLSGITNASTTFLQAGNMMYEIPPGGENTFAAASGMTAIEYSSLIDKFIITTTGANGIRSYVTSFTGNTFGQMQHIFLIDSKQLSQSFSSTDIIPHPSISALNFTPWSEGGMLYLASAGTTSATNFLFATALGADDTYVSMTNQVAIAPAMSTPNCTRFTGVFSWRDNIVGGDLLGKRTDGFHTSYRISGITDNTGTWTELGEPPVMTGITGTSEIQLMYEFETITDYCMPARIFAVGILYEDSLTDSHYRFSATLSSITGKTFSYRMTETFGGVVPTLRIRLYNDETNALLIDDNSSSPSSGTWYKSTDDGNTWGTYNTIDKINDTTYIRYTPSSLADDIKVRSVLTLN